MLMKQKLVSKSFQLLYRKCNSDAPNDYTEYNCTDGQIVHVNLVNFKVTCGEDDNRCPGAFHVGCDQPGDNTTTTTTSTGPSLQRSPTSIMLFSLYPNIANKPDWSILKPKNRDFCNFGVYRNRGAN